MINIPMKSSGPLSSANISDINRSRSVLSRQDLSSINNHAGSDRTPDTQGQPHPQTSHKPRHFAPSQPLPDPQQGTRRIPAPTASDTRQIPAPAASDMRRIPSLRNLIQKGQKMSIGMKGQLQQIRFAMGWNTLDPQCDIDLSAYLLDSSGKVPADDWFVFYGQTRSPDGSVLLDINGSAEDREIVSVDLTKLHPSIRRIVFVLTINEAFTYRLNFSMVKDAYIRLLNPADNREILSFLLTDYYANVTSMMLGEIYLHNDNWKFNAIGNGVAKDLAGLCELYGVQTN